MYRRKIITATAAAFAIGAAFAAQTTSVHADREGEDVKRNEPWAPGTNMLMSAHEERVEPLAPPR